MSRRKRRSDAPPGEGAEGGRGAKGRAGEAGRGRAGKAGRAGEAGRGRAGKAGRADEAGRGRSAAVAEDRSASDQPRALPASSWGLGVQVVFLAAVFAIVVLVAELAGAANLGVALGIGQIGFAIAVVYVLLRR
jgi:hypothetical protein